MNNIKKSHDKDQKFLNKIAFDDDAQVVELTVVKKWTEEQERIEFELEEVKNEN